MNARRLQHLAPLAAVQAIGLGCGLVGVRLSSSLVPPEVLGLFGLLVSAHGFGAFVTHQAFIQHAQKAWTKTTPARAYLRVLRRNFRRPTLWLAVGLAGVLVVLDASAGTRFAPAWWVWLLVVNLLAFGAHLAHVALQAEERYWAHFAVSAVCSVTRSFLPLLLVFLSSATLAILGAGFLMHALLWMMAGAVALAPAWSRPAADGAVVSDLPAGFLGTFAGVGLCGWLAGNAPRWFAALALTPDHTGYFMLAVNITTFVPISVSMIALGYLFPPLFAASRAGAPAATLLRMTTRGAGLTLLAAQAALLALAWCGPRLVGILVTPRYASSMDWLLAAGGGTLATVSAPFFCNYLTAIDRGTACLRLTAWSAGLRVAILAVLAFMRNPEMFRVGLALIAWPTFALEWWIARRELQNPNVPRSS